MIRLLLATGAALAALFISGCATQAEVQRSADAELAVVNLRALEATARIREAEAEVALSSKVDAGGASAYLIAKALKGLGAAQPMQVVQPQPSIWGGLWQATLGVADLALRAYGIKAGRDVAITQSNNQASTTIASYGAFSSMGSSIERAGTAGYPYIQAPGAITTTNTTNTLSGTGVLGAGSYVGPVTTTRTCNGGTAGTGAPSNTVTGSPAPGGSAMGGNC